MWEGVRCSVHPHSQWVSPHPVPADAIPGAGWAAGEGCVGVVSFTVSQLLGIAWNGKGESRDGAESGAASIVSRLLLTHPWELSSPL